MRHSWKFELAIALALVSLWSCGRGENTKAAQDAVDLGGYQLALDACRADGKDAGSYKVYETCAQSADVKFGRKP